MSEMIERAARALYAKHHADKLALIQSGKVSASMSGIEYYEGGWAMAAESTKEHLRSEVRAVVEAMREPTPAMEDAADEAADDYEAQTGKPLGRHAAYRAMIDAALTGMGVDRVVKNGETLWERPTPSQSA